MLIDSRLLFGGCLSKIEILEFFWDIVYLHFEICPQRPPNSNIACVCVSYSNWLFGIDEIKVMMILSQSYDEVELWWLFWLDCCFSWRMTDLILPTSLTFLDCFGLNSHSEATRSHSVPGAILSVDLRISISEVWEADRLDCWSLASYRGKTVWFFSVPNLDFS